MSEVLPGRPKDDSFTGERPTVDIVVPTRDRAALVDVTIDSLRRSRHPNFTLWIVDQSDDEATEHAVASHCRADSRVRYLRSNSRGSNRGREEGAAAGRAPYVLFTDDDCRVEPDWVDQMVSELVEPAHSAVFGRVIPDTRFHGLRPDGTVAEVPRAIRLAIKDHPHRQEFTGNRFRLGFGHGANMGLRRDVYEAIGGFDPLLGTGGPLRGWPERDLGYRLLSRGWSIVYTPEAIIHHRHWRDWKQVRATLRDYGFGTGAATGKYLRSGDWGGIYLFVEWILDQGVRQVLSGAFKWRSWSKIEAGVMQIIYPWIGLWSSLRYPVDRDTVLYKKPLHDVVAGVSASDDGDRFSRETAR